jgi:hypothetical protein
VFQALEDSLYDDGYVGLVRFWAVAAVLDIDEGYIYMRGPEHRWKKDIYLLTFCA